MYDIMLDIFDSYNKPFVMKAFSIWHILYLLIIIGVAIILSIKLQKKPTEKVKKTMRILAGLILGVYILDFFCMPFSIERISVDKLPFHFCTLGGILIFVTRFNTKLRKYKECVTVLALVATLMYTVYPSSAFNNSPSPFCYSVIQTFVFHGLLLINGVVALTTSDTKLSFKKFYEIPILVTAIIVWAFIGNTLYSHEGSQYDWGFIRGISFPALPGNWMILGVFVAFTGSCALVYLIYYLVERKLNKQSN